MRTTPCPGFQADSGTRISIWRRVRSVDTLGAGVAALPVAASSNSALAPCTVRKYFAGDDTPAPCGQATAASELPIAIGTPGRVASFTELRVTRNPGAFSRALTGNSTRPPAL